MDAPMTQDCRIGEWTFDAAAGDLRRGDERRRLEDRAARTLAMLCRRRGEVVSQAEITAEVWNGRSVSANSLPVVIADLRRALGDDARQPRFIETVAKRGYRLLDDAQPSTRATPPTVRSRTMSRLFIAAFVLFMAVTAYGSWRYTSVRPPQETMVFAPDVINETGRTDYAPMAAAVSERVSADLARLRVNFARVRPGERAEDAGDARVIRLTSRLILWTGKPTVMFTAEENGRVTWSGMAEGPEPRFPATVRASMTEFAATLKAPRPPKP
jgi:DNA-binding winged helix-turn-helix (wHTH) protein